MPYPLAQNLMTTLSTTLFSLQTQAGSCLDGCNSTNTSRQAQCGAKYSKLDPNYWACRAYAGAMWGNCDLFCSLIDGSPEKGQAKAMISSPQDIDAAIESARQASDAKIDSYDKMLDLEANEVLKIKK